MRSSNIIASLPRMTFTDYQKSHSTDDITKKEEEEKEKAEEKTEEKAEETCPVCMDCFAGAQVVSVLPCQHFFHVECCEGWLKVIHTTPCERIDSCENIIMKGSLVVLILRLCTICVMMQENNSCPLCKKKITSSP